MTRTPLTCGDLFAGAGGLSVGFHAAGFESVFFNEFDANAGATFSLNFPKAVPFIRPVQDLSAREVLRHAGVGAGDMDVMLGGPPCQGFSINAPVRSKEDERNHLFHHYVRLVLEGIRPKFVVLENVPGLISFDEGKTVDAVKRAFERAGYRMIFRVLNAAHYGVPEERWRLVFLGTRLHDVDLAFPEPKHFSTQRPNFSGGRKYTFSDAIGRPPQASIFQRELKPPISVGEAIDDLPEIPSGGGAAELSYSKKPRTAYQRDIRVGSARLFNHECANVASINQERMKHVPPGGSWRDIPFEMLPAGMKKARRSDHTRRYGRLDPKMPSGTILTKCDPHWGTVFHYEQERIISVREAARIQSFPDWFRFTGSKADQYRQVGNAVPPLLAKALAETIRTAIEAAFE